VTTLIDTGADGLPHTARDLRNAAAGLLLATAAAIFVAGCGGSSGGDEDAAQETSVVVSVERPLIADAARIVRVNGGISADRQVTVFSTVPGRVVARKADLGEAVSDGQVIVVVDHSQLDMAVRQARSAVSAAEEQVRNLTSEFERVERLFRERGASQQQFDAIRTQKLAAEEGLEQARTGLDQALRARQEADIRAPFSGVIGRIHVEAGDMVGPGVPIAVVVDPRLLIANVQIPERDIGLVAGGQPALVSVASFPGEQFEGRVRKVSPILDVMTRMGEVEIQLPNTDGRLKPGMFATVEIEVDRHEQVLMVPSDAVMQQTRLGEGFLSGDVAREYYVFVKRGDRAARLPVRLGYTTGDRVEISHGIAASDSVVVMGQHLLEDGRPIEPAGGEWR